jgi:hypothetical protein
MRSKGIIADDNQSIPKISQFIYKFSRIMVENIEIYSIFVWIAEKAHIRENKVNLKLAAAPERISRAADK